MGKPRCQIVGNLHLLIAYRIAMRQEFVATERLLIASAASGNKHWSGRFRPKQERAHKNAPRQPYYVPLKYAKLLLLLGLLAVVSRGGGGVDRLGFIGAGASVDVTRLDVDKGI